MHIAEQKYRDNIAEYILYMWQIEDIIRAFDFDIEKIEHNLIRQNYQDEELIVQVKTWYDSLLRKMVREDIKKAGHLNELGELLGEMYFLHSTLLNTLQDETYVTLYNEALGFIQEFKQKSNLKTINEVEICLTGLYTKLLLKLRGVEITKETEEAFDTFRKLISYLTKQYHKMKRGELNFHYN
jgi:hypothetical protein